VTADSGNGQLLLHRLDHWSRRICKITSNFYFSDFSIYKRPPYIRDPIS